MFTMANHGLIHYTLDDVNNKRKRENPISVGASFDCEHISMQEESTEDKF